MLSLSWVLKSQHQMLRVSVWFTLSAIQIQTGPDVKRREDQQRWSLCSQSILLWQAELRQVRHIHQQKRSSMLYEVIGDENHCWSSTSCRNSGQRFFQEMSALLSRLILQQAKRWPHKLAFQEIKAYGTRISMDSRFFQEISALLSRLIPQQAKWWPHVLALREIRAYRTQASMESRYSQWSHPTREVGACANVQNNYHRNSGFELQIRLCSGSLKTVLRITGPLLMWLACCCLGLNVWS